MLPTAHVASALLAQKLSGTAADGRTAVAGGLLPDLIDKTLAWVLRITPSGRHVGHTLLAAVLVSLGVAAIWGRRPGVSTWNRLSQPPGRGSLAWWACPLADAVPGLWLGERAVEDRAVAGRPGLRGGGRRHSSPAYETGSPVIATNHHRRLPDLRYQSGRS